MEKQEKKEKKILTENRMTTVNKRETSYEGLVSQLENGEDGIYNLVSESKVTIFQPKVTITKKDVEEIPYLKQLRDTINIWEDKMRRTEGKDAFIIKKALIEMRKEQYIIKNAYKRPLIPNKLIRSRSYIKLDSSYHFDEEGYIIPEDVSLCDPRVCSAILCNYSKLKQDSDGEFEKDLWFLLYDFENTCDRALKKYPLYMKIVECKIDGMQNIDIQQVL